MPVHPQCQFVLDQLAEAETRLIDLPVPEARQLADSGIEMIAALAPPATLADVTDLAVNGPAGPIAIRTYHPHGSGNRPGVLFFHGGGFVIGNLDTHDPVCRLLAERTGAVVVAVDYRLAPEHPFPAAVDDCFAVLGWVAAAGHELGIDTDRIAVCGDSAGGNLAAVVSLLARDIGGPGLRFQALMYPGTDHIRDFPSMRENAAGYLLDAELIDWFRGHYVPEGTQVDTGDPRLAPLRATSHRGLPPALVITAEYDPLRDEGEAYGAALEAAGVPVTVHRYDGMVHGFWNYLGIIDAALEATDEVADALRAGLS